MTEGERFVKIESRLEAGQKEFGALRDEQRAQRAIIEQLRQEVQDVTRPKPMSRLQVFAFVAGPVLGVCVLIGGFVWQAARYPDRSELNAAQGEAAAAQRSTTSKLYELDRGQLEQKKDLEQIKAAAQSQEHRLNKIDEKLDRALSARGR
jgi:hypothetical protein